jgi:transposase
MEERRKKARELRSQGYALKNIAEALNVSLSTASQYCRNVLPKWKNAEDARKRNLKHEMKRLYSRGISIPELADWFDIPVTTLYDWRRELGIKRNARSVYVTDELRNRISEKMSRDKSGELTLKAARLYLDEELSTTEIARQLGVSSVTISQWLSKAGIERRKSPTVRTRHKLRQANLGARRYNWKGGITKEQMRKRASLYMRLAREACFERDDYRCRICGERGRLNAHHIWPFQRFPERMYDVNNLVTLCKDCHDGFHKAAGGHVKVAIGPFFGIRD